MGKECVLINNQKGNALIYVLIAIVLFAGLGFTLSRETGNENTKDVDRAKASLIAIELITYATQTKSAIDQMVFTGSTLANLDLTIPGGAGYTTAPHIHKLFHPEGGGLMVANIPKQAVHEISTPPAAGWYVGQFNNVEWTKTTGTDIIATAHQIAESVCKEINRSVTDSDAIPALPGDLDDYLIDTTTDLDLDIADCAQCEGYMSMCVSNAAGTAFSFFSIVADR